MQTGCNLNYALINFVSPAHIPAFYQEFNARPWARFNDLKLRPFTSYQRPATCCAIAHSRIQGKAALIAHLTNAQHRALVYADGSGHAEPL